MRLLISENKTISGKSCEIAAFNFFLNNYSKYC